jgi:hypothetical protein
MTRDIPELLALAEERIAQSEGCLRRQRDLIETLGRSGHDTTDAAALQLAFKQMQAQFIVSRDQLREELEQIATG